MRLATMFLGAAFIGAMIGYPGGSILTAIVGAITAVFLYALAAGIFWVVGGLLDGSLISRLRAYSEDQ